jgi:hypothetical protein
MRVDTMNGRRLEPTALEPTAPEPTIMLLPSPDHDQAARLTEAARYHDYRNASNPLGEGGLAAVPGARFPAELHERGITRTLPLDTSAALGCPGLWHSHHNESGHPAHVLPIQDAGLHTHLRTLDIRFARRLSGGGHEVVESAG